MKLFKLSFILAFALVTITSCKDDEVEKTNAEKIIGSWILTNFTENGITHFEACDELETVTFDATIFTQKYYYDDNENEDDNEDGNCNDVDTFSGTYTIDGDVLLVASGSESNTGEIQELTGATLKLRFLDEGDIYISTYDKQ